MSERGQMRRRLREQSRLREALLLDLGALVYELHRQGKRAPELLQQKAAELTVVDEEVRELQAALEGSDAPAQDTMEVEAPEEAGFGEETEEGDALDDEPEEGALDEEPEDDGLDDETGEERALGEDEPRAEDDSLEHEEPRA